MKRAFQILLGLGMAVLGLSGAHATCQVNVGFGASPLIMQTAPTSIGAGALDLPDGSVLFSTVLDYNGTMIVELRSCDKTAMTVDYDAFIPGDRFNTVRSGIPGVGMRVSWVGGPLGMQSGYLPLDFNVRLNPVVNNFDWRTGTITMELVKTGPLSPGTYAFAGDVLVRITPLASLQQRAVIKMPGGATPIFEVKPMPSCRVSSPSVQVPLGNVALGQFSGVGSASTQSRSFNIELACLGGYDGVTTQVFTTLTDQTNPANESDTLSLAAGSTASGVGIQVLSGATVVKYGPDSSAAGNTNQWSAGTTGNGTFTIPLKARYVQTAPTVTAGSANGLATFTMNYQ